jgi:sulfofructose kinase
VDVRFVGKVGDDDRGALIERTMSDEGVATDRMIRSSGRISQVRFVFVERDSGRRHAYFTPGNVGPLAPQEIDPALVDEHQLLLIDSQHPQAQLSLMKRAKDKGIPVVLEANHGTGVVSECVPFADVIVASERQASSYTGVGSLQGILEAFLEKGPTTAILTLGDEGAVAMGRDEKLVRVEAKDVDFLDPTGASDVFLGAVALGTLEGWELERLVRFANAAAGLACTGPGGRSAIADRDRLQKELS